MDFIIKTQEALQTDSFEAWIKIISALGSVGAVLSLLYLIFFQQRRNNIQQFESSLFNLLSLHNQIVSNLQMKEFEDKEVYLQGRTVFNLVKRSIDTLFGVRIRAIEGEEIVDAPARSIDEAKSNVEVNYYSSYYERFEPYLNHYFRNLYHIFLYIDESSLIKNWIPFCRNKVRYKYAKIVRAQLSQNELLAIMLNCIIQGYGYPLLKLDKKYNILKNFRHNDVKPSIYYELYLEMKKNIKYSTKEGGIIAL